MLGNLELRQVFARVTFQRFHAETGAGARHDDGSHRFAEALVGNAEDGALGHAGMLVQDRLDFLAADVLAAPEDHVLRPVRDENEVFLVHVADVAGAHPSVHQRLRRLLGPVPVAFEIHRAPDAQLAGFAPRDLVAVIVDDLDLDEGHRGAAAAAGALDQGGSADGRREPLGFGHAPARAGGSGADLLVDVSRLFGRHGRAAASGALQARQVEAGVVRRLHELPRHDGNAVEARDAFGLDDGERFFRVPPVHGDHLASGAKGLQ